MNGDINRLVNIVTGSIDIPFSTTLNTNCNFGTNNIGTLTNDCTINPPKGTPEDTQILCLRLIQDSSGNHIITWDSIYQFCSDIDTSLIPLSANSNYEILFKYLKSTNKWRVAAIIRGY